MADEIEEVSEDTPKKKKKKKNKKGGGFLGKFLCLLLGFLLGIIAVVGGVIGVGYYAVTQPIDKTLEKVESWTGMDLYETLFGEDGEAGILNPKYAELKVLDLVGVGFLAAVEHEESSSGTAESATDGAPVSHTTLEHFHHGEGEGVVRSAVLVSHGANDAVESAVTAAEALVPVALVGNVHSGGDVVNLVGLPAKQTILLVEEAILATGHFGSSGSGDSITSHSGERTTNSQTTHSTKHCSSAEIHNFLQV